MLRILDGAIQREYCETAKDPCRGDACRVINILPSNHWRALIDMKKLKWVQTTRFRKRCCDRCKMAPARPCSSMLYGNT